MRRGRGAAPRRSRRIARVAALLGLLLALPGAGGGAALTAQSPYFVQQDSIRVVFWDGQEGLARRTLREASAPLPLPGIPGDHRLVRGTIYLAPSPAVFDSLTGGGAPHWAAGVALPAQRRIVLPAYGSSRSALGDPIVVLRHELAHLAVDDYLPRPIPRWFNEGYATWVSGGFDESAGWQIRFAFLLGRGPPLDSLTLDWPRAAQRARLAYLLSASAVRHLATRSGERGFEALLLAWREQGALDPALRSTYQMTLGQFEREWRGEVRRRYGWLLAISQIGAFWVFVTLLFLVLGTIRKRRDREKLARMEAEDLLQPPDAEQPWMMREEDAAPPHRLADPEPPQPPAEAPGAPQAKAPNEPPAPDEDRPWRA